MKRIALASLLLVAFGCGETKGPPPGAPKDKDNELKVELPGDDNAAPTDKNAPADKGAPADKDTPAEGSKDKDASVRSRKIPVIPVNFAAGEWGTLKGKFVVDGKVPEPAPLKGTEKDNCNKHKLVDETIAIDDKGNLANAFVFLRTENPAVAPSYKDSETAEVVLDNHDCRFEPHALVCRVGQKLILKNSDPFSHNSNIQPLTNPAVNPILPPEAKVPVEFKDAEKFPTKVGCNIHNWMGAWVLIRKDPYAAVSDKDGTFVIKDLPAGKDLEFTMWQEEAGFLKNLTFKDGKTDTKGRFKLKLKAGDNDLGEIKVPVAALKKK